MQPTPPTTSAGSSSSSTPTAATTSKAMRPRQTAPKGRSFELEFVDVDEEYQRKYVLEPEDLIVPIDAGVFRQGVREKERAKEMEMERSKSKSYGRQREREGSWVDAQRRKSATAVTANVAQPAPRPFVPTVGTSGGSGMGSSNNFPSAIGPTIQNIKAKRALASTQQQEQPSPLATPPSHSPKRRRIDAGPTTNSQTARMLEAALPNSNLISSNANENAIAGPSRVSPHKRKIASTHPSTTMKVKGNDVMVISDVDDSPRKRFKSTQNVGGEMPRVEAREKRVHEVIELSSDSEIMEVSPSPVRAPKRPRLEVGHGQRQTPIELWSDDSEPEASGHGWGVDAFEHGGHAPRRGYHLPPPPLDESEESDDDEWGLPGMDLNNADRWNPMPDKHDRVLDNDLDATLRRLDITETPTRESKSASIFYMPPDTTMFDPRTPRKPYSFESTFVWDNLAHCRNVTIPPRRRPVAYGLPNRIPSARLWDEEFGLHKLTRAFHDPCAFNPIKKAPGSVNRIEQKGQWTVIASSCKGGLADVPNEIPFNNNREGSLMTWNGELDIPVGHQVQKTSQRIKYYAVHDIKFDPLRDVFVSSGADLRVRLWTLSGDDEKDSYDSQDELPSKPRWTNRCLAKYDTGSIPHDLAFNPKTSILAVAERKLRVYDISKKYPKEVKAFTATASRSHVFGAIVWGMQSTSDHLFASTEPTNSTFEGFHKVYDINKGTALYQFDASEAGDTLSLGPSGGTIALSTRDEGNKPILRLYDVARCNKTATSMATLDEFPVRYPDFEGEVNCSVFSPDGILLALARNDNQTHVYDLRSISRGPIHRYKHTGECKATNKTDLYGAVKAQWLQSTRSKSITLITGGEDGCVRLWDPNKSEDNGQNGAVIAEVDSDIGHFSVGDPFAGEHRLVVGDCSGEFSIFDSIKI